MSSSVAENEKRDRYRENERIGGGGREEARDTERIRPKNGLSPPPHPTTYKLHHYNDLRTGSHISVLR